MPRPVHIGRKGRKGILEEACLDITEISEDFHDCVTPEQLYAVHEKVARYLTFIRELDSGILSGWGSVSRVHKLIGREQERLKKLIGEAHIHLVEHPEMSKADRAEQEAEIRRDAKRHARLREAWLECRRWEDEHLEEERDSRAEERVGGRCLAPPLS